MMDAHPHTALQRRIRRLLLAYPRDYRRRWGDEIVTTLLDAAAPDQRELTAAQRWDLLSRGLRCRFGIRGGPLAWLAAVVLTLVFVLAGAAAGNWWDWRDVAPPPGPAETAAITRAVVPNREPTEVRRIDHAYGYEHGNDPAWLVALLGGDDYHAGLVEVGYHLPPADHATWFDTVAAAQQRLHDAGWTISEARRARDSDGQLVTETMSFTVRRGSVMVEVGAYHVRSLDPASVAPSGVDSAPYLTVDMVISRVTPSWGTVPVGVGAGLGLLFGWTLAAALARHVARLPDGRRAATGVLSLLVLLPHALVILLFALETAWDAGGSFTTDNAGPLWAIYMVIPWRPLFVASGLVALVALGIAAWPTPERPRVPRRTG